MTTSPEHSRNTDIYLIVFSVFSFLLHAFSIQLYIGHYIHSHNHAQCSYLCFTDVFVIRSSGYFVYAERLSLSAAHVDDVAEEKVWQLVHARDGRCVGTGRRSAIL